MTDDEMLCLSKGTSILSDAKLLVATCSMVSGEYTGTGLGSVSWFDMVLQHDNFNIWPAYQVLETSRLGERDLHARR